jgi:hypothetical protein
MKTSYILDSLFSLSALRAAHRKRSGETLLYESALPNRNPSGDAAASHEVDSREESVGTETSYTAWSGGKSTPLQIFREVQSAEGEDQKTSLGASPSGRNANVQR